MSVYFKRQMKVLRYGVLLCSFPLFFIGTSPQAVAHGVYLYAWIDEAQICTESYFTPKDKVRSGEVSMLSATGEVLAKKQTNSEGQSCFDLPSKAQSLEFVVLAGAGHKATFTIAEEDVMNVFSSSLASNTKKTTEQRIVPVAQTVGSRVDQATSSEVAQGTGGATKIGMDLVPTLQDSSAFLQKLVETSPLDQQQYIHDFIQKEVQKQTALLRQELAKKSTHQKIGFREVFGGIGWLIGLSSLGYWWSQKRKED